MNNKRVYTGADGLRSYLAPQREEYIPLVELPDSLNPFLASHNIHVSAKLMNTLPLGNVKSLPAHELLASREVRGAHVVESSSGNTVFSMGLLAQSFGVKDVTAIASTDVSPGKLRLLQLAGVNVELIDGPICPDANDPHGSIAIARERGTQLGWCNPGQYNNDANPHAHETITGPQLYDQLGDELGMFVAGLGTTGTLVGTARALKKELPTVQIGGVLRVPNNKVPGVRTRNGLDEVAFAWNDLLTEAPVMVNEYHSYEASLRLIREGLLVGPSSGFAYEGALALIKQSIARDGGASLRGKHVVFICPDTCFPYVDEYVEVLGVGHFPAIDDQSTRQFREAEQKLADIPEVSVAELHADMVDGQAQHYTLIDVRDEREFLDHHIAGSQRIDGDHIAKWARERTTIERQQKYLFICSRSGRSIRAAVAAQNAGLTAYLLTGGTAAWSAAGYERVRPNSCYL